MSSPFLAGEDLLYWVLDQLKDYSLSQANAQEIGTKKIGANEFTNCQLAAGQFTPTEETAGQFTGDGVKLIFLIRNIYDLLIDQYRYFSRYRDFAELSPSEGIAQLLTGSELKHFALPGLGKWLFQIQAMLRFSTRHASCVLSYEKLIENPAAQIKRITDFLSVELTTQQINDMVTGLSREIAAKTGAKISSTAGYRYSLSCECIEMLTGFHSDMINKILVSQAPDLGSLSTELGFPEVTARSPEQLQSRFDRIFVSTVFKSGTKLIEYILAGLTGLVSNAPGMDVGSDYESADPISFERGKFFIWHNVPSDAVKTRLRAEHAKPIFLIRNIYDLAVSQYYHFADDVDEAIGHSTRTAGYFKSMGRDEGISLLLCGATSERFHWHGFSYYLQQIQGILQFSREYPCHVIIYDRLVLNKRGEIERLAKFLDIDITANTLNELLDNSSLDAMRKARITSVGSGKHFRMGAPGDHVNVLKQQHYHMINHLKMTHAPTLDVLCAELGFSEVTSSM